MVSLTLEEFVCIFNGVVSCVYVFQIGIITPSIVSLTLEESIKVTQKQKNEGMDILQCVRSVVMVLKVLNFKEIKRGFD
jgi:ammonia channel protein AmtB